MSIDYFVLDKTAGFGCRYLYKNLQTLFRFFFFRILEKLFWVPPKELDLRLEYAKSAERSEEALPHFSFMSLNSLLN